VSTDDMSAMQRHLDFAAITITSVLMDLELADHSRTGRRLAVAARDVERARAKLNQMSDVAVAGVA
jgi:hypothetical protein